MKLYIYSANARLVELAARIAQQQAAEIAPICALVPKPKPFLRAAPVLPAPTL